MATATAAEEDPKFAEAQLAVRNGDLNGLIKYTRAIQSADTASGRGWHKLIIDKQNAKGETLLHIACLYDCIPIINHLVKDCAADTNMRTKEQETMLHLAAFAGHLRIVDHIIANFGLPMDARNEECEQALHYAAKRGHVHIVRRLVHDHGADPSAQNNEGNMPLHLSSFYGHENVAQYLVGCPQVHIDARNHKQETALHLACKEGRFEVASFLVANTNADPNVRASEGQTPLYLACVEYDGVLGNHLDIVELLIQDPRVDVNIPGNDGKTVLHLAVGEENYPILKKLRASNSIDCNVQDHTGATPFHLACAADEMKLITNMLTFHVNNSGFFRNIDVNIPDNNGDTPLHFACRQGSWDFIKFLLEDAGPEFNFDINARNHRNETILHAAFQGFAQSYECKPLLTCFKLAEVLPNVSDSNGQTVMHLACWYGCLDFLEQLVMPSPTPHGQVQLSIDMNCYDVNGKTPFHYACETGRSRIVDLLVSHTTADVLRHDRSRKTGFHMACENGHLDVVKYLVEANVKAAGVQNLRQQTHHMPHHVMSVQDQKFANSQPLTERDEVLSALMQQGTQAGSASTRYSVYPNRSRPHPIIPLSAQQQLVFSGSEAELPVGIDDNHATTASPCQVDSQGVVTHPDAWNHAVINMGMGVNTNGNAPAKSPIDAQDCLGKTGLHLASEKRHVHVVEYLLDLPSGQGVDVSIQDHSGRVALYYACAQGDLEMVKALTGGGNHDTIIDHETFSIHDIDGSTPLFSACKNGHTCIIDYFLKGTEVGIQQRDPNGNTILHIACVNARPDIVGRLIKSKRVDANAGNNSGDTPLHVACAVGCRQCVEILIHADVFQVDVNARNIMGDSPFHHACSHRNMDVIKLLMSSPKVDTVIQNHKGNTVLHDACKVCHLDVLQWLTDGSGSAEVDDPKSRSNISRNTENGINSDDGNSDNNNSSNDDNKRDMPPAIAPDASPQPKPMNEPRTPSPARPAGMHTIANVQNNEGNTALHCACIEGHLEIVTYMLSTFALDVSIQNMNGMAPLHHASKAGHAEIARLLLNLQSNRDDVNLQNRDGQTSLHLACQQDHFDIVATLMNQEAIDCNVRDDDGNVPIWYACRKSALDIVNLLVSSGKVDVNVCNKRNETLLRMVLRLRDEAPLQEAILRGAGRSSVTVQWYTELEK